MLPRNTDHTIRFIVVSHIFLLYSFFSAYLPWLRFSSTLHRRIKRNYEIVLLKNKTTTTQTDRKLELEIERRIYPHHTHLSVTFTDIHCCWIADWLFQPGSKLSLDRTAQYQSKYRCRYKVNYFNFISNHLDMDERDSWLCKQKPSCLRLWIAMID